MDNYNRSEAGTQAGIDADKVESRTMTHKHCVFCGEEIPTPRPTSWRDVCESPANTLTPDTVGNRSHAYLVGKTAKQYQVASRPSVPQQGQARHYTFGCDEASPVSGECYSFGVYDRKLKRVATFFSPEIAREFVDAANALAASRSEATAQEFKDVACDNCGHTVMLRRAPAAGSTERIKFPCADCGREQTDKIHLDSAGTHWGAALHWYKTPALAGTDTDVAKEKL